MRRRGPFTALATRFLPAVILLPLLAIGFAGAAAAGGPTSVLLVVPGENRTASLYTGDRDYEELVTLLDAFNAPTGSTSPPNDGSDDGAAGTADASGPGVTLTWLIHDISVWRVDRVYLNAENGPWMSTQTSLNGDNLWAQPPIWRTVKDGPALTALLDRLGVGNAGSPAGSDPVARSTAPAPNTSASPDQTSGLPGPDGLIWASLGVLLGATLTLAIHRWAKSDKHVKDVDTSNDSPPLDAPSRNALPAIGTADTEARQPRTETLSSHDA